MGAPSAAAAATSPATPAMQQYARFKAQHPDCVLFFRMGDFYEMFHEDAVLAHAALGITLTQRTKGVPMAGVPYHSVEPYLRRMIDAGYRVAVCDQIQDAAEARGVVDRAVTRVLTPGTLVDEALLDEGRTNRIAAIDLLGGDPPAAVLASVELSTGTFELVDLPAARVIDEVVRIGPSELLYAEPPDGVLPPVIEQIRDLAGCSLTARPPWSFRQAEGRACMQEHFGVATLVGFGIADDDPALSAGGAVLRYLRETQAPDDDAKRRLGHLRPPCRQSMDRFVTLDATTLHNLEIERTMRTGAVAGSVLSIFGRCRTSMGKRQLRDWLCFPLRDLDAIETRQRAVAAIIEDRSLADTLGAEVAAVQDVARIVGRISMGRATPRDVVALGVSVARAPDIDGLLDGRPAFTDALQRLRAIAEPLAALAASIGRQCVQDPPAHLREGGLFREGVDAALDEAMALQRNAHGWLAEYQQGLVSDTGINSLKVGYNKVFGYYIEVTHAHVDKVPVTFSRKQTLKNAERYITPELKTYEDDVTSAQSRAIERERILFESLCGDVASESTGLAAYADVVAKLDVLLCFAEVAKRHGYCRPSLVPEPRMDIRQGRHPVLGESLAEQFVPNDCVMGIHEGDEAATLALITGPNMAGKSTYIRQVALITLLAHTGSFVPAESATIGLTDRIFTRVGAGDELHAGRSTFMVEMTEAANILHHATDRSVVILDEIGRGTSTLDGLSLAWAITETLAARGCRTLFATHYHELTSLADEHDNIRNLHVSVREWGDRIIFLYRILPGQTNRSYGIHVARLAGVPAATVDRASDLLETLAVHTGESAPPASRPQQMSLFTEYIEHPAIEELRSLDLTALSPLEAFDILRGIQERLQDPGGPAP